MIKIERLAKEYVHDEDFGDLPIQTYDEWYSQVQQALNRVHDGDDLRFMIDDYLWLELPIEVTNEIFEHYLAISNRDPEVLRAYATHIHCHYDPSWDDKVARLREEAAAAED